MRIQYIYNRWSHHSPHSGYDRLVDYLGSQLPVIDFMDPRKRIVPWRAANLFVGRRSGIMNYSHQCFYAELSAAKAVYKQRGTIFHFLYGDYDYRYSGLLNGMHGNRITATYHLPPGQLVKEVQVHNHFNCLGAVFVVGKNQVPFFEQYVDPKKIYWIPHGIDTEFFQPAEKPARNGKKHLLFVGRYLRDLDGLVQVIRLFHKFSPNVRVSIVGGDAPAWQEIAGFDNVEILKGISEQRLLALYQNADALLLPLIDATANNSLLEALACGLPAVVTDIGGIRDYVDSTTSAMVPPGDTQAMFSAACELLESDSCRQKLAAASRTRALDFSWPAVVERMRSVYTGLYQD